MQLATIGYEGTSLADFIAALVTVGVERVVDIREIAQSRRPGFSKKAFSAALAEAGIDYYHIRQLGDPKKGREAARAGDFDLFRTIFTAHIELPASRSALANAVSWANEKKAALVCFERDHRNCHRTIVAERMATLGHFEVLNLEVQSVGLVGAGKHARSADQFIGACP
jgi:uncharacterized protein (DUF488 family)